MIECDVDYFAWDAEVIRQSVYDSSITEYSWEQYEWDSLGQRFGANIILVGKKRAVNKAIKAGKFLVNPPHGNPILVFASLIGRGDTSKKRGVYCLRGQIEHQSPVGVSSKEGQHE